MADDMERIEKALEGNGLALSAVAEVLQKMDARLAKAEEEEEEREEEKAAAIEKMSFMLGLSGAASEVASMLKADQGMDVSGDERKAKTTGGSASNADDSESAANISSKIEQQQNTIQAMQKADDEDEDDADGAVDEEKAADNDDDEDEDATKAMKYKADDGDDEDDDDDDEMKSMQKELDSLRKQLAAFEGTMEKAVQEESENRLRKMGFKEETGLVAPQLSALGTDGTTPIVKSATEGDTVDQLANLSYGELRDLQMRIQAGDTNGVPKELLG